jgi:hypothetical protein
MRKHSIHEVLENLGTLEIRREAFHISAHPQQGKQENKQANVQTSMLMSMWRQKCISTEFTRHVLHLSSFEHTQAFANTA